MANSRYQVGSPSCVSDEGKRLSGFSWLCPCGDEFLSQNVEALLEAKKEHHREHQRRIRDLSEMAKI